MTRGRGALGADFARGLGARGAGLRPRAPLPNLGGGGRECVRVGRRTGARDGRACVRGHAGTRSGTQSGTRLGVRAEGLLVRECVLVCVHA